MGRMLDLSTSKAIIHNLTFKGIEAVSGILNFDQRGILYAEGGDVLITQVPPEESFLKYLEELGWDFSEVGFVSPEKTKKRTYSSIFYSKRVKEYVRSRRVGYIDTYHSTSREKIFSKAVGLPLYTNPKIGVKYGTKSGFRLLARKVGLPISQGFERIRDKREVVDRCIYLFEKGCLRVAVKIDEGVSGAGCSVFDRGSFMKMSRDEQEKLAAEAMNEVTQIEDDNGVVVEQWVDGVKSSPSVQLEILPEGDVRVLSSHDQLFDGEKEKWYIGCVYPPESLREKLRSKLEEEALLFTKVLSKKGYVGFLGLDAVVTIKGEHFWVEANVRKPATFYPRIIAEKLNRGRIKGVSYIAADFTVKSLRGKKFGTVRKLLGNFEYPMNGENEGVVIYNAGALKDAGRFDVVCLSSSGKRAKKIFDKISRLIKKLGEKMPKKVVKHYVKDLSLASEGKKKIEWAEGQMPVLRLIRERFRKQKVLNGIKIDLSCHLTSETANLARTLKAGGADVLAHSGNPVSTQDDVSASLVKDYGIMTFGARNIDRGINKKNVSYAISREPDIAIDDGAEFISVIYKRHPKLAEKMIGGTEETTTGLHRFRSLEKAGLLKFPIIGVNDARTKTFFDNRYGTGQSTIDGILRATNILLAAKTFVVVGYGWCGKGVAMRAKGMGANVVVCEVNPILALEAAMDGFRVMPVNSACKIADVLITVTGGKHVVSEKDLKVLKDGAVIGNSGHFNVEIDLDGLKKMTKRKRNIRFSLDEHLLKSGKKIYLVGEGRLANLAAAEGHPASVMDMSFANQALAAEYLVKNKGKLDNRVLDVPKDIDKRIASLKLKALGIKIDKLTEAQDSYLNQWEKGGYDLI